MYNIILLCIYNMYFSLGYYRNSIKYSIIVLRLNNFFFFNFACVELDDSKNAIIIDIMYKVLSLVCYYCIL